MFKPLNYQSPSLYTKKKTLIIGGTKVKTRSSSNPYNQRR